MAVNLKALATHLNLSQTTVSRALNGYPEVSERTRAIVSEAANRLGYSPNQAARRLATGKAGAIGYVMTTGPDVQSDPHFMEFLSGVGEFAITHNFDIHIAPSLPTREEATYRRLAATRQVDAVFVSAPVRRDRRIEILGELDLPFIVHGRSEDADDTYAFIDIDNEGGFRDATRLLIKLGHRRIAIVNGEERMTFADHRERGAVSAHAEAGIAFEPRLKRRGAMTEAYGYRSAIDLLDGSEPPTAFLCSSMIVALGVIRALTDRRLEAGRDISVIAHDDVFPYLKPENFRTPLTCVRSPIRKAGFRVAERLAAMLSGAEAEPVGEIWPVELVVRDSIGPAPR
ncbi:MAG: substrate-binding domain-containing protein [Phyllobacteriaceae bacterium]|nr:substrate-binding domain-containing protein [Phyllobacteriaceae bacterium]